MSSLAVGSAVTSVLVAYATKYGSTQEVAEAVATALREHGADVEVRAAGDVVDMSRYSAVVLGGALYFFRWHRDARRFLSHHRTALVRMPVAVFALGPLGDSAKEMNEARGQLDRALAKAEWLSPASVAVFGGRLDPTRLRFPDANPAMKKMPASDLRDWDAIQDWADSLPEALGLDA
jgi:menaquinone-dependent protoporphyrinogen oxidase